MVQQFVRVEYPKMYTHGRSGTQFGAEFVCSQDLNPIGTGTDTVILSNPHISLGQV